MSGLTAGLSNPNSYGNACYLDNLPVNCTAAAMMVNHGSAQVDSIISQGASPFSPWVAGARRRSASAR